MWRRRNVTDRDAHPHPGAGREERALDRTPAPPRPRQQLFLKGLRELARAGADQQRVVGVLEAGLGRGVGLHAGQQREGAVLELHHHALERLLGLLVRDFQQLQDHGLVLAQHFARGDAEQQGVTDLTGGAGDGDADGGFGHEELLKYWLRKNGPVETRKS